MPATIWLLLLLRRSILSFHILRAIHTRVNIMHHFSLSVIGHYRYTVRHTTFAIYAANNICYTLLYAYLCIAILLRHLNIILSLPKTYAFSCHIYLHCHHASRFACYVIVLHCRHTVPLLRHASCHLITRHDTLARFNTYSPDVTCYY